MIIVRSHIFTSTPRPDRRAFAWLSGFALAAVLLLWAPTAVAAGAMRGPGEVPQAAEAVTASGWMRLLGILLFSAAGAAAVRLYDIRHQRHLELLVAKRTKELTAEIR